MQLALAGHTPRAPLRSSDITSDLAEVFFQPSRMASCFISARLNLRLLAKYRGGAQGREKLKFKVTGWALRARPALFGLWNVQPSLNWPSQMINRPDVQR